MPNDKMSGTMGAIPVCEIVCDRIHQPFPRIFFGSFIKICKFESNTTFCLNIYRQISQFIVSALVSKMPNDKMSGTMGAIPVCEIFCDRIHQPFPRIFFGSFIKICKFESHTTFCLNIYRQISQFIVSALVSKMPNDKMSGTMGAFLFVKLSVYVFINHSLEYSLSFTFSSRFVDLNVTQLSG